MSLESVLIVVGCASALLVLAAPVFVFGMRRAHRDHEAARQRMEEDLARPRKVGPRPKIIEGHRVSWRKPDEPPR